MTALLPSPSEAAALQTTHLSVGIASILPDTLPEPLSAQKLSYMGSQGYVNSLLLGPF